MAYEVNVEGHEVAVERNGMEWKLYVDSDLRDSVRESFAEFLATMPWTTILRASIGCRDGRKVGIKFEISSGAMSNYVRFLLADKKIKKWKNRTVTRRPASGDTGGPVSPVILFVRTLLATGIIAVTILMIINGVGSRSASNGPASTASVPVPPSSATLRQEQALRTGSPPKIERVETFREGALVFVRLFFNDPDNDATGFGFRGVNGARWAMENHPFSSPSYGRVSPGK